MSTTGAPQSGSTTYYLVSFLNLIVPEASDGHRFGASSYGYLIPRLYGSDFQSFRYYKRRPPYHKCRQQCNIIWTYKKYFQSSVWPPISFSPPITYGFPEILKSGWPRELNVGSFSFPVPNDPTEWNSPSHSLRFSCTSRTTPVCQIWREGVPRKKMFPWISFSFPPQTKWIGSIV